LFAEDVNLVGINLLVVCWELAKMAKRVAQQKDANSSVEVILLIPGGPKVRIKFRFDVSSSTV
jgi:hypothetical protein